MYHYGANNPVKYTDPNGRENSYSFEILRLSPDYCGGGGIGYSSGGNFGGNSTTLLKSAAVGVTATAAISTAIKAEEKSQKKIYLTYTMTNSEGKVYSGRTSGYGTPETILAKRLQNHHMKTEENGSYGSAKIDQVAEGLMASFAIRGREQQLIDKNGGAISDNGSSGNKIRGVRKWNPLGRIYHNASNARFGELHEYTGM